MKSLKDCKENFSEPLNKAKPLKRLGIVRAIISLTKNNDNKSLREIVFFSYYCSVTF